MKQVYETYKFEGLPVGAEFTFEGTRFIKLPEFNRYNAAQFSDSSLITISKTANVTVATVPVGLELDSQDVKNILAILKNSDTTSLTNREVDLRAQLIHNFEEFFRR